MSGSCLYTAQGEYVCQRANAYGSEIIEGFSTASKSTGVANEPGKVAQNLLANCYVKDGDTLKVIDANNITMACKQAIVNSAYNYCGLQSACIVDPSRRRPCPSMYKDELFESVRSGLANSKIGTLTADNSNIKVNVNATNAASRYEGLIDGTQVDSIFQNVVKRCPQ